MSIHFNWICAYRGAIDYQVTDETGTYRAEFRYSAEYDGYYNGTRAEWERDVLASVGILRRYIADKAPPAATVAAFNEWRLAERAKHVAQMKAQPDRYGEIDEKDARLFPPIIPARGGHYVVGTGWVLS